MPLSPEAVRVLERTFRAESKTYGWPGSTQYRFEGDRCGILIWSGENQADWFVGAQSEAALEACLQSIWNLDNTGPAFYGSSPRGERVLRHLSQARIGRSPSG
ncbi:MAG: hypothetical protein U0Q16_35175 [Bryobacteraceae bacterium]